MLLVDLDYGVSRSVQFVFAFEGSDLGDENIFEQFATLLCNEVAGRCRRSTRGNDVVYDDNRLSRHDRACLHLKFIRSILLLERGPLALSWQLPTFAHRHKCGAQSERYHRSQEESTGIECDDNIDLLVGRVGYHVRHQVMDDVRDERLEGQRIAEKWENVTEDDAFLWEILVECEERFDVFNVRHRSTFSVLPSGRLSNKLASLEELGNWQLRGQISGFRKRWSEQIGRAHV